MPSSKPLTKADWFAFGFVGGIFTSFAVAFVIIYAAKMGVG